MGKFIKKDIKNYDYFITLRTDIDILFDFSPKKILESTKPSMFNFDANYCRRWGGWGSCTFAHKNYIFESLTCFDKVLRDNQLIKKYYKEKNFRVPNQETFFNYCYKIYNLNFNYIKNLNLYMTADDFNTVSPRSKICYSIKHIINMVIN